MVFITFTRKKLFVILLVCVMAIMLFYEVSGCFNNIQNAKSNKDRVDFAKNIGYAVSESCLQIKNITLSFNKNDIVYKQKNGYDLYDFAGCKVTVYSYLSTDKKGILDIFVYKNRVIGYRWKNNELINL